MFLSELQVLLVLLTLIQKAMVKFSSLGNALPSSSV